MSLLRLNYIPIPNLPSSSALQKSLLPGQPCSISKFVKSANVYSHFKMNAFVSLSMLTMLCNHQAFLELFSSLETSNWLFTSFNRNHYSTLSLWISLSWSLHTTGITYLCDLLVPFSILFLVTIHIVICVKLCINFFVHYPFMYAWTIGLLLLLTLLDNSAIKTRGVNICLGNFSFVFDYIPRLEISGLFGDSVKLLRNWHIIFCNSCTILCSFWQCTMVLIFTPLLLTLAVFWFCLSVLIIAILIYIKW